MYLFMSDLSLLRVEDHTESGLCAGKMEFLKIFFNNLSLNKNVLITCD